MICNIAQNIIGSVNGQVLTIAQPVIAADSVDYLTAQFSFSEDWTGADKFAFFAKAGHENEPAEILLTDDEITADAHLNLPAGRWNVWLVGLRTEGTEIAQRITTTVAEIRVQLSGVRNAEPFPGEAGSAGEQIVAQAIAARNAAQTAAQNAGASANSAAAAAVSAAMSEDNAQEYAENAENSAQTAAANANSTLGYKNDAIAAKNAAITAQTAAEAAQTAAEAAQTAAETASTTAEAASTAAEAAQTAAEAAANAAEAASTAAETAKNAADVAATNAASSEAGAEEAAGQAIAAKDAAVDAKEYIEGVAIDIGEWYHYNHTSDATYSANFLKTGSTINNWSDATAMRSSVSAIRTVGDDLYIFAFGYKWTRESMAMLPMEIAATVEQLYRRFLINDKVVIYGVRESFTKDIYVVSFGYTQGEWFYTNTRMDGSKVEVYWNDGSLDFSSFVVRYSNAATPYADDVELDNDTLEAIQSKLDISTKLSELEADATHRTVTDAEKSAWNAKSNFSGSYDDLTDKPTIPAPTAYITHTDEASINITLADNTEYTITNCASITLAYPTGRYEAFISVTFGADVSLTFPTGTRYIGDVPTFAAGETWEISVKNGVVVAGKVE